MKRPTAAEKRHMAKIAAMPCLVCGKWPVEVHHVVGYADRMGRAPKRSDRIIGLCAFHHRVDVGPFDSVHALGHQAFCEAHGVDLMAEAERLWAGSGG